MNPIIDPFEFVERSLRRKAQSLPWEVPPLPERTLITPTLTKIRERDLPAIGLRSNGMNVFDGLDRPLAQISPGGMLRSIEPLRVPKCPSFFVRCSRAIEVTAAHNLKL